MLGGPQQIPWVDVGGVPVGALSMAGWLEHLSAAVGTAHHHVSLNASKWVAMGRDPLLRQAVFGAQSIAADGMSVVLAARRFGGRLPERVPGVELAEGLLRRAAAARWPVALIGAREPVLTRVVERLRGDGVQVVFAHHGYFPAEDDRRVATAAGAARPALTLLALGTPRAERFAHAHAAALGPTLVLGVGGAFDVLAGTVRRAPRWVGDSGLEWAWRWAGAPGERFHRAILDSVRFTVAMAAGRTVVGGPE
jgi:N-acetylglucosaminyldiphosphoundecaprenol N-acetyl-beta-D-mannosaminyltransferase